MFKCDRVTSLIPSDGEPLRRRVAALSLPSLLNRCHASLASYVADEMIRGGLPFPRAREEELLYILRKLLDLSLWPASLWAAFAEDPTRCCTETPRTFLRCSCTTCEGH